MLSQVGLLPAISFVVQCEVDHVTAFQGVFTRYRWANHGEVYSLMTLAARPAAQWVQAVVVAAWRGRTVRVVIGRGSERRPSVLFAQLLYALWAPRRRGRRRSSICYCLVSSTPDRTPSGHGGHRCDFTESRLGEVDHAAEHGRYIVQEAMGGLVGALRLVIDEG
jgi:hypothetical protein